MESAGLFSIVSDAGYMKTESLLGISLELMDELSVPGGLPADARVGRFFRQRRYLGSRDRRVIGAAAYAWLRYFHRARARWDVWAGRRGSPLLETLSAQHPRLARLAESLALARDALLPWDYDIISEAAQRLSAPATAEGLIPGGSGSPPAASGRPSTDAPALAAAFWSPVTGCVDGGFLGDAWPEDPAARLAAEMSLPAWFAGRLVAERGLEEAGQLATALLGQATVDLRVNLRLTSRESARKSLARDLGIEVELTPYSPMGLRLEGRRNLTAAQASRRGWIEIADEGSQIVTLCLDAAPGMVVLDACAGAGGKTLALADLLDLNFRSVQEKKESRSAGGALVPSGRLVACDTSQGKLEELVRRATEAEMADGIQAVIIDPEGELPPELPDADLVLVDAPCSGFGTLRRNPDLKNRYDSEDIAAFAVRQKAILDRFASKVKPGGRLAYVTCSLLEAENEAVAKAFTAQHAEFVECPSAWAQARLPLSCQNGSYLRLDPLRTSTDAFFLAMWQRQPT